MKISISLIIHNNTKFLKNFQKFYFDISHLFSLLFFIHSFGKDIEGAMLIAKDLYWGGDFTMLKDILKKDKSNFKKARFFIGYAGWDPGQLALELEENSWIVKASFEDGILNQAPKNIWKDTLRNMGNDLALLSFFHENPQLN
jgi:putative transcriptional regulator